MNCSLCDSAIEAGQPTMATPCECGAVFHSNCAVDKLCFLASWTGTVRCPNPACTQIVWDHPAHVHTTTAELTPETLAAAKPLRKTLREAIQSTTRMKRLWTQKREDFLQETQDMRTELESRWSEKQLQVKQSQEFKEANKLRRSARAAMTKFKKEYPNLGYHAWYQLTGTYRRDLSYRNNPSRIVDAPYPRD